MNRVKEIKQIEEVPIIKDQEIQKMKKDQDD